MVVFPAPLPPTRAVTVPRDRWRSMPLRTWTSGRWGYEKLTSAEEGKKKRKENPTKTEHATRYQ